MHTFSVGEVLKRSFGIWLKNLVPFTLLTLLVYSPLFIYTFIFFSSDSITASSILTYGLVTLAGGLTLSQVAAGAVTYGVIQQLRGQHAGIGKCISVGISRLIPVILVGLLVLLCIAGGLLLLIVPGVILACMLYVAVPAAVVERPGVFGALKRSADLTKGYKGSIFGLLFIIGIIENVISKVVESAFATDFKTMDDVKVYFIVLLVVAVALGALRAVTNAVAYHDLRLTKEGVDVNQLAAVFD